MVFVCELWEMVRVSALQKRNWIEPDTNTITISIWLECCFCLRKNDKVVPFESPLPKQLINLYIISMGAGRANKSHHTAIQVGCRPPNSTVLQMCQISVRSFSSGSPATAPQPHGHTTKMVHWRRSQHCKKISVIFYYISISRTLRWTSDAKKWKKMSGAANE